jgi:GNAT superfamily N-acetyltransferase
MRPVPVSSLRHIVRNLWHARRLAPFPATRFGDYLVEPLQPGRFAAAEELYRMLNPGARLGFAQRLVLRLAGSRLCLIARPHPAAGTSAAGTPAAGMPGASSPAVVAFTLFYFNARDIREGTIHAGYNGLHPAAQGAGLGTFMLRHALASHARAGLAGASSRVSTGNRAALKANEKAGFLPLETYFDAAAGEERHYLVCDLGPYRAPPSRTSGAAQTPPADAAQGKGPVRHGQ